jgi:hypothetical protein
MCISVHVKISACELFNKSMDDVGYVSRLHYCRYLRYYVTDHSGASTPQNSRGPLDRLMSSMSEKSWSLRLSWNSSFLPHTLCPL